MTPVDAFLLITALAAVPTPANVRAGADRALPLLVKSAQGHVEKQTCFACHNQTLPLLAVRAARDRGLVVKDEEVKEQTEHIAEFLGRNKAKFRKGEGTGGQVDSAGYALYALELGGYKADEVTAAVVDYLILYQADRGHWRTSSNRPPSEASSFTVNYFAVRGLRVWGSADQREAGKKRVAAVRAWLAKAEATDTEDRVFRLLLLKELGAAADDIRQAADALAKRQRPDGSWAQLDDKPGDAYATGSALVALHRAGGLATTDPAYKRGLGFLLRTQAADGSWRVTSRSKPFQPYYETGFPYKADQFISAAASGWAAAALLDALP